MSCLVVALYGVLMEKYTFWAKTYASNLPGISVLLHGRFASAVGRCLVRAMFPPQWQDLHAVVAFLLSIHDVGKISPQFQGKCLLWLEQNGLAREAANNAWPSFTTTHACLSQEILDYF